MKQLIITITLFCMLGTSVFSYNTDIVLNAGCEDFNGTGSNWQSINANFTLTGNPPNADGTQYLKVTDGSGGSIIYNATDYSGDFSMYKSISWDYKVFNDGWSSASHNITPQLTIYSGNPANPTLHATFYAYGTITENSNWINTTAPLSIATGSILPSNSQGFWQMPASSTTADWNILISSVTGIKFRVDIAGSGSTSEILGIDNICIDDGCNDSYFAKLICSNPDSYEPEHCIPCLIDPTTGMLKLAVFDQDGNFVNDPNININWNHGPNGNLIPGIVNTMYYFTVVRHLGSYSCSYNGSFVELCCDNEAPFGLKADCHGNLSWQPSPTTNDYIVEITWNSADCCLNSTYPSMSRYYVTGTNFSLPYMDSNCYSWRVGVKCNEDSNLINWSNTNCRTGKGCASVGDDPGPPIILFPNPVSSQLTIDFGNIEIQNPIQIQLFNSQGEEMYYNEILELNLNIDVQNWANGVYTCVVTIDNNQFFYTIIKE